MQYESVFKVIGYSCYTCLPRTVPAAAQTAQKTAAPGTGTGAPPVTQRLLTNTWPTIHNNKHTSKHQQKLRNNTSMLRNSTLN